ncbi:MAG TPA: PilN domain-containing protein [Stellaceae bacterium]|nr:PilN domain-containing protein [Stellaceae bacterium]
MIAAFFAWWVEQLSDLLPPWLRPFAPTSADALIIAPAGPLDQIEALSVTVRRNGREEPVGRVALGAAGLAALPLSPGRPVALRLSRTALLEKTLTLPLAAQAELDQVLRFEMDRETPFTPEELYWNHRIEAVDRQHGRLQVRLLLLPRSKVAPLLSALAQAGIVPSWAEVTGGEGPTPYLRLDRDDIRPEHQSRHLVALAAAACGLLAAAVVATPFIRQAAELAALDRQLAVGRSTAARAEGLRQEIDRLSGSVDAVKRELSKSGRPLEILSAVTRALPDDTYLTEFALQHGKLTLSGRSAGAARLIGALARGGEFHNPTFAAPVTRLEALRAEIFTITADVGPQP